MLKRNFKLATFLICGFATNLFAGGEAPPVMETPAPDYPFYLKLGTGASFSSSAGIHVDTRIWDPTINGYDGKLNDSELYEFGVGFVISPTLSAEVVGSSRPSYEYTRFQRGAPNANNVGNFGDKTRFFKLSNQNIIFNLIVDTKGIDDKWTYQLGEHRKIRPILGAGGGVAYNKVYDFHSTTTPVVQPCPTTFSVASIMNENKRSSFAYQLMAGLRVSCHDRISIDFGYRYFNAGRFETNSYLTDISVGQTMPITVPSWTGKLKANEVFVSANVALL